MGWRPEDEMAMWAMRAAFAVGFIAILVCILRDVL